MKITIKRALALVMVCVTVVAASSVTASAQSNKTTNPTNVTNSGNTLRVSPVRTELDIKAGESGTVTVSITNLSTVPAVLKVIENDFVAGDEKGTPSVLLDENSYAPTHSLKRFMIPVPNITVKPNETKDVPVTIRIPASAQAGGYFGAIRFAPAGESGSSTVGVSTSVTSLVLVTVPGDLVEQLTLTNFDVQQNGNKSSNFRTPENLELALRFASKGNVQVAPFGQVSVKKGDKVVFKQSFNSDDPKANVLPDSARKWTMPLKGMGKFGKYTIQGNFSYGTKNESIEVTKTFWVIPTMYLVFAGIGLLVLIGIIALIIALIRAKRAGRRGGGSHRYY